MERVYIHHFTERHKKEQLHLIDSDKAPRVSWNVRRRFGDTHCIIWIIIIIENIDMFLIFSNITAFVITNLSQCPIVCNLGVLLLKISVL